MYLITKLFCLLKRQHGLSFVLSNAYFSDIVQTEKIVLKINHNRLWAQTRWTIVTEPKDNQIMINACDYLPKQ